MPFDKPWQKPEPGHLIYGLNETMGRKWYLTQKNFNGVKTIDEYPVTKLEQQKSKPNSKDELAFLESLGKHKKYKDAIEGPEENAIIRAKDKGGLYWATLVAGKHVHFVLDGIDLPAVVGKSFKGKNSDSRPGAEKKNRSITGSELRWVYRNRAVKEVQDHIQFWFGGEQCGPPWVALPSFSDQDGSTLYSSEKDAVSLWAKYSPRPVQVDHAAAKQEGKSEKDS
jgi:hypothetical protein